MLCVHAQKLIPPLIALIAFEANLERECVCVCLIDRRPPHQKLRCGVSRYCVKITPSPTPPLTSRQLYRIKVIALTRLVVMHIHGTPHRKRRHHKARLVPLSLSPPPSDYLTSPTRRQTYENSITPFPLPFPICIVSGRINIAVLVLPDQASLSADKRGGCVTFSSTQLKATYTNSRLCNTLEVLERRCCMHSGYHIPCGIIPLSMSECAP